MTEAHAIGALDRDVLRQEIRNEYREVARQPDRGFHFHTGRTLARLVEYQDEWLEGIPEPVISRFAGTGNPFSIRLLLTGERVVDLGCGAGIDSFIAARHVGPEGAVVGIDMTPEMLDTARSARAEAKMEHLEFRQGYLEQIPVEDGWADVVISNGVINLCPTRASPSGRSSRAASPAAASRSPTSW
jgi:2-polyprenyl-3-methyl-5-hydroxy-6-metoxy-1,4-benzoquinol methylase